MFSLQPRIRQRDSLLYCFTYSSSEMGRRGWRQQWVVSVEMVSVEIVKKRKDEVITTCYIFNGDLL